MTKVSRTLPDTDNPVVSSDAKIAAAELEQTKNAVPKLAFEDVLETDGTNDQ